MVGFESIIIGIITGFIGYGGSGALVIKAPGPFTIKIPVSSILFIVTTLIELRIFEII